VGSLDDAIREHLELKRARGASEDEVQEKAAEAFGAGPSKPSGGPASDAADARALAEPEPDGADAGLAERPGRQGSESFDWETGATPAEAAPAERSEPAAAPADPGRNGFSPPEADDILDQELLEPDEVLPEDSLEPERARPAGEEDRPRSSPEPVEDSGDESIRVSEGTAGAVEDEEPVEDFLEETPDFLEETPEHDRLWFELKPPKDFDFD
jgi:hypothetical protein